MNPNYKAVLLTVLTLSVFTLVIIELSGISSNSLSALLSRRHNNTAPAANAINTVIDTRSQQVNAMPKTMIKFEETHFNFGTIPDDKPVTHVFRFKNTGPNPMMIARTDVSCGCTVPKYSLNPVPPDSIGEITVTFNPKGKSGVQHKNIMVHSNAQAEAMSIGFDAIVK